MDIDDPQIEFLCWDLAEDMCNEGAANLNFTL